MMRERHRLGPACLQSKHQANPAADEEFLMDLKNTYREMKISCTLSTSKATSQMSMCLNKSYRDNDDIS